MNRSIFAIGIVVLVRNVAPGADPVISIKEADSKAKLSKRAGSYRTAIRNWRAAEANTIAAQNLANHRPELAKIAQTAGMFKAEVERAAKSLGEGHLIVLHARATLAQLHRSRQAWSAAAREQRKVVSVSTRLLGAEDRSTIDAMDMLANDVSLTGNRKETVKLRRSIYLARKRRLGIDHPKSLSSRCEYAGAMMRGGEFQKGEAEFRALIAQDDRLRPKTFYPSQHRIDLASFLQRQNKLIAARLEAELAVTGFEKTLGRNSPAARNARRILKELGGNP